MSDGIKWPYLNESGQTVFLKADIVVLGAGIAGCMAAIAAAKKGCSVVVIEKAGAIRSGAGGSGCDHWEQCATNPCSRISPEQMQKAMMEYAGGFSNPISHYIEARESWDRLLELEEMGAKIRDTEDRYAGAAFRDDATKLLFAYDYHNRTTLRVWGSGFKPVMIKEMQRLGINIIEHVAVTSLLTKDNFRDTDCIGATGISSRTGKFYVVTGKAVVMALSRPARLWLFSAAYPGLSEFRPLSCIGSGHAMGWRAGAEFTMMEKSVRAEFSAAGRSFPPYGAGNNHNSWYPASLIDARGVSIPYIDRDGRILSSVAERFLPAPGQDFFLKGGNIDKSYYPFDGPETLPYDQLVKQGYKLPFYADLSDLPPLERDIIWGMMISEEGKTKIPVFENYRKMGFDPQKHVLQCYGEGWKSSSFLPSERQLFGPGGGFMHDWRLMSNLKGLFIGGDALFASNCYAHAAATGSYAGRQAAEYIKTISSIAAVSLPEIDDQRQRLLAPLNRDLNSSITWKELNQAIAKTLQNYCGEVKEAGLLEAGLSVLVDLEINVLPQTAAANPHELIRLLEVYDILTVAQLIIQSCQSRTSNCESLDFIRNDDQGKQEEFIILRKDGEQVIQRHESLNFAGDIVCNYEAYNRPYLDEQERIKEKSL